MKKTTVKYVAVSIAAGVLFGCLDGLINGNSYARELNEFYKPIAKTSVNWIAGFVIDMLYGFIMTGIFIRIYKGLPGKTNIQKGLSYAFMAWFFRVAMAVASQWMIYSVPPTALLYQLLTGLGEMLIIGMFIGHTIKPVKRNVD